MGQKTTGFAPTTDLCDNNAQKTREELLSEAFAILLKLSPEQIMGIIEKME